MTGPVQTASALRSNTSTATCSFTSLPAAGNYVLVLVGTRGFQNTQVTGVADNQTGNTYSAVTSTFNTSSGAAIYLAKVNGSSGTFTVTVTDAGAASETLIWLVELPASWFSGTTDQTGTANSTATGEAFSVSCSAENANADDVVFAVFYYGTYSSSGSVSDPPATGFTSLGQIGRGNDAGYKIVSARETSSASWTSTFNTAYSAAIASFKVAAALKSAGTSKNTAGGAPTTRVALSSLGAAVSTSLGYPGLLLPAAKGHNKVTGLASLSTHIPLASGGRAKSAGLSTLTNWASVTLATPLYIGNGSILAPGSPWSNGAPAAGDTVYYDPTNLAVYSNGEVTGASDLFKAQVEWLPSPGVSSSMTVQFSPFASVGASVSRSSGNLTTSIPLVSKSLRVSSGVAGFSVAAAFHSQGHAKSSGLSGLTTAIALASVGSAKRTGRASMLTSIPFSSHASNRSTGVAAMTSSIALTSKGASVVVTHAAMFSGIALRSIGASKSTGTGDQRQLILFTSAGRSVSIGRASLLTSIPLASVGASKNTSLGAIAFGAALKSRGSSRSTGSASITTGIGLASASFRKSTGTLAQVFPARFGYAIVEPLSQSGVQPAEPAYVEQSAVYVEATYFDSTGVPFVPNVVEYRVDDVGSGQNLLPWTSVQPAQTNLITIPSDRNTMVNLTRNSEQHMVLVKIVDGFGDTNYEDGTFEVIRVPGIG